MYVVVMDDQPDREEFCQISCLERSMVDIANAFQVADSTRRMIRDGKGSVGSRLPFESGRAKASCIRSLLLSLKISHLSDRAVLEVGRGMPGTVTAGSEQKQHRGQKVYTGPCEFC